LSCQALTYKKSNKNVSKEKGKENCNIATITILGGAKSDSTTPKCNFAWNVHPINVVVKAIKILSRKSSSVSSSTTNDKH
jgi:hypothetical protein